MSEFRLIKRIAHGKPEIDDTHKLYWEKDENKLYVSAYDIWWPIGENVEKYIIKKNLPLYSKSFTDIDPGDLIGDVFQPPQEWPTVNLNPLSTDNPMRIAILSRSYRNANSYITEMGWDNIFPSNYCNDFPVYGDWNYIFYPGQEDVYSVHPGFYLFYWFNVRNTIYLYYTGYGITQNGDSSTALHQAEIELCTYNYNNVYFRMLESHPLMWEWYESLKPTFELPPEVPLTDEELRQTYFDLNFPSEKFRIRLQNCGPNDTTESPTEINTKNLQLYAKFDDDAPANKIAILSQDYARAVNFDASIHLASNITSGTLANLGKYFKIFKSSDELDKTFQNLTESGFLYGVNFNETINSYVYFSESKKHYKLTIFALPRALLPELKEGYNGVYNEAKDIGEKNIIIIVEKSIVDEVTAESYEVK
jgi:hypothetical protein